ncbi:MAG: hypothetical protein ACKOD2_14350 [Ilumatobacteraceae bacterium]
MHQRFVRAFTLTALVAALLATASCSKGAADFRKAAEKAIGGADAARMIGEKFDNVQCETPSNTAKGSTFTCSAIGASTDAGYTFTATIKSSSRVEITDYRKSETA